MAGWVPMPPMRSVRCRHAVVAVGPHGVVDISHEHDELLQVWAPQLMNRADSGRQIAAYMSGTGYTAETQPELEVEQAERHARIKRAAERKTERARVQLLQSQVLQHGVPGGEIQALAQLGESGRGRRRGRGGRGNRVRNMYVAGVDDLAVAAAAAGL